MKKKICIVTGSRADYGLLKPLMDEIAASGRFILQVVATGMHMSDSYGLTFREIEADGFSIDEKVDISLTDNTSLGIARSTSLALSGMAEAYMRLDPDIVVLLGDRFEIFAAAAAALISKKPVAHIHGGEVTAGAMDESFRHCITKMSCLHFTSTEEYRKRVIQMGEIPGNVHCVGAIGIDNIRDARLLSRKDVEEKLKFELKGKIILVTYHPETLSPASPKDQFLPVLAALDRIEGACFLFTGSNADEGGTVINGMIEEYVCQNPKKAVSVVSMGRVLYLSAMSLADAVVGNSSSGMIEAPSFSVPTVNIGARQEGRIRAGSVIDADNETGSIVKAIDKALDGNFKEYCRGIKNPYGEGGAAKKITDILAGLKGLDIKKKFCDTDLKMWS